MTHKFVALQQRLLSARPQLWLALMLLSLHGALAWGISDWWSRGLLLAHFGLFLLWQPVWRGERALEPRQAILVVILGVLLTAWSSWWLMALWIAVLFALVGGNLTGAQHRSQRVAASLAAVYLLSLLLIWVVPHLFVEQDFTNPLLVTVVRYGLPGLPLVIAALPFKNERRTGPLTVDLFYSLLLFLLVCALVLGSFVIKEVNHGNYPLALAQTLFAIALMLVALSWLWNPRSGFVGIGHLLSRYLLSLGLPFERWMQAIADVAESETQPESFVSNALNNMRELPWVAGVTWQTPHGEGSIGETSGFVTSQSFQDLQLKYYTRWSLSPPLLLHLKLLTQIVGHFYEAKQREQLQLQNAYTQAIYDTGARLTHDVKNLLQSLKSLCAAAESNAAAEADALNALIRRQLPQITQRLTTTLEKLQAPQREPAAALTSAAQWWESLKSRHARADVVFEAAAVNGKLPGELFDSVAENLLANAFSKAQRETGTRVSLRFDAADGGRLTVCDSGSPIPRDVAGRLLQTPVASQTGLGVGLYQATLQAERLGYRLQLVANQPGRVCFELGRAADGVTAARA
ncbi:MAG: ATP-binding protein [Burkholderiales bacterium]